MYQEYMKVAQFPQSVALLSLSPHGLDWLQP
ncbi:hypothetical protein RDI58_024433 [Solanum bulbocastanum]|uniref:Uncharacterized protein n=1 Tax=Solanum bulbocastanum TaxID=147425 RepID=A0AAN8Y2Z3_SOLBU